MIIRIAASSKPGSGRPATATVATSGRNVISGTGVNRNLDQRVLASGMNGPFTSLTPAVTMIIQLPRRRQPPAILITARSVGAGRGREARRGRARGGAGARRGREARVGGAGARRGWEARAGVRGQE